MTTAETLDDHRQGDDESGSDIRILVGGGAVILATLRMIVRLKEECL